MSQFDYFPTFSLEIGAVYAYSAAALRLLEEIQLELLRHGLRIASVDNDTNKLEPGNQFNFIICDTYWNPCRQFKSLGQLDKEVGHLIRTRGSTKDSKNYIGDMFLPRFSDALLRRDSGFAKAFVEEDIALTKLMLLTDDQKHDLLNFYTIKIENQKARDAIKAYNCVYRDEQDLLWNYFIYQKLYCYKWGVGSPAVGELIDYFTSNAS